MKSVRIVVSMALCLLQAVVPCVAQVSVGTETSVRSGDRVRVIAEGGSDSESGKVWLVGDLVSAGKDSVAVRIRSGERVSVPLRSVTRFDASQAAGRGRWAFGGLVVGAGLGVLIGSSGGSQTRSRQVAVESNQACFPTPFSNGKCWTLGTETYRVKRASEKAA
ncbi:MAG: hypothetical protein CME26_04210 [Gemmatimonadetes bacterium]|nr:hypothetical protein [Gemmatimonadota bacterium]